MQLCVLGGFQDVAMQSCVLGSFQGVAMQLLMCSGWFPRCYYTNLVQFDYINAVELL